MILSRTSSSLWWSWQLVPLIFYDSWRYKFFGISENSERSRLNHVKKYCPENLRFYIEQCHSYMRIAVANKIQSFQEISHILVYNCSYFPERKLCSLFHKNQINISNILLGIQDKKKPKRNRNMKGKKYLGCGIVRTEFMTEKPVPYSL